MPTTSISTISPAQLADAKVQSFDHAFRMRHADGRWLWLRARCELARQDGEAGLHLIGIAVDITEQKSLVEKTVAADLRLRDAIETIPEAFVLWDADNRLVLCNSNFQALHHLPDEAVVAGTPYETVVAMGRKPIIRTTVANDDGQPPRRAHLRSAARRRALDAHQRAAHQGRRLRFGRHRHHQDQAARAAADRGRKAPYRHHRRSAQIAAGAGIAGRSARRSRREICRGEDARRGGQSDQIEVLWPI